MLELVVWPLTSVRSNVTTSPLAWGSIRTVRDLGRMSPVKVDRAAFSVQVPKGCPAAGSTSAVARESRCNGCTMNMDQHVPRRGGLQGKESRSGVVYAANALIIG